MSDQAGTVDLRSDTVAPVSDQAGTVDLRSDTVTRPTPAMRAAMAEAEVGDDGFRDDPTVERLVTHADVDDEGIERAVRAIEAAP